MLKKKKKNPSCKSSPPSSLSPNPQLPLQVTTVLNFSIFLEFLYEDISKHKYKFSFSCMFSASIRIDRGVRLAQHETIPCSAGTHLCRAGRGADVPSTRPGSFVCPGGSMSRCGPRMWLSGPAWFSSRAQPITHRVLLTAPTSLTP